MSVRDGVEGRVGTIGAVGREEEGGDSVAGRRARKAFGRREGKLSVRTDDTLERSLQRLLLECISERTSCHKEGDGSGERAEVGKEEGGRRQVENFELVLPFFSSQYQL